MRVRNVLLAAGAAMTVAAAASAQETIDFVALNGGSVSSGGSLAAGIDRNLSPFLFNYTFANSFMWGGSVTINGTLRENALGTFGNEARIRAISPSNGGSLAPDIQGSTLGDFTGSIPISRTLSLGGFTGLPFNPQGQTWSFRFFESFNDSGTVIDSFWDAVTVTFNVFTPPVPPTSTNLGTISNGNYPAVQTGAITSGQTIWYSFDVAAGTSPLDIFTFGSNGTGGSNGSLDTELGLYNSNGFLVATNDDIGGVSGYGNFSSRMQFGGSSGIDVNGEAAGGTGPGTAAAALAAGTYYLALTTFNATFAANDFNVTAGTTNSGDFRLTIVPTPGAAALLGLGILAAGRRRRA